MISRQAGSVITVISQELPVVVTPPAPGRYQQGSTMPRYNRYPDRPYNRNSDQRPRQAYSRDRYT